MKKVLFGLFFLGLALIGIFHSSLITTYDFYDFQKDHPNVLPEGTVIWETMSFTSTARSGSTHPPLVMKDIAIPVPFPAVYEKGETYVHAYNQANDDQSITAFVPEKLDFFAEHSDDLTEEEQASACRLLRRTSATQACDSPQKFYEAYLKLRPTDVGLFSKSDEKQVFLKLMIIKGATLPSTNVSEFETEHFTGFFYRINERNFAAHLFPDESTMYPVNFNDMTEAEATAILSDINF